jgi:hypothetical protein
LDHIDFYQELSMKGGRRPGAGRPKGSGNKFTKDIAEMLEGKQSPLEFMLEIVNNTDNDQRERLDAAKAAAPYIHARISHIEMKAEVEQHQEISLRPRLTKEEWLERMSPRPVNV